MADEPFKRRPSVSKLSKTPSWVMLGFILGAFFVWALPTETPEPRQIIVAPPAEPEPSPAPAPAQLTTVETLFADWAEYAVWSDDRTEIAMWNTGTREFSDYYEVRRVEDALYFRSLPSLTRRILTHGKAPPPECPLRFTETEEQYREWREHGRYERPPEHRIRPPLPSRSVEKPKPTLDAANQPVLTRDPVQVGDGK